MSAIRALANDLAARSDTALRELLNARPDLILPPVPDFAALAARASTRVSIQRALENLTEPQLQVLEAVVLSTHEDFQRSTTAAWLRQVIAGSTIKSIEFLLAELSTLALLRRTEAHPDTPLADRHRRFYLPVSSLHEALGPYPAGLGRTLTTLSRLIPGYGQLLPDAVTRLHAQGINISAADSPEAAAQELHQTLSSPAGWKSVLECAPPGTVQLLEKFNSSPVGTAPARRSSENDDVSPLPWLLTHGLLARLDATHVELPRTVGQAARGQVIISGFRISAPAPDLFPVRVSLRDNAAYGAVAETLRLVTDLVGLVANTPVATLRTGGVGVREIRRLAEALRVQPDAAAWLMELSALSDVLTLDVDTSRWIAASDGPWFSLEREQQWRQLVSAWLDAERAPSLVGAKLPTDVTVNALAAEANRPDAPVMRRRMLSAILSLSTHAATSLDVDKAPVTEPGQVVERLGWQQPRLLRRFARLVPGMMTEAAHLGLLGSGALTDIGKLVAEGNIDDAASSLGATLPAPLRHFLLQADLTAVAPGYLAPSVARELGLLSVAEGQGPATIHRFSGDSIRRALDAGQDASSILAFLAQHSATDVPQPLTYLVEDTASRYGRLRVGQASSYIRSDDDAALTSLLADPRAAALGLVQLAPTVIVAQASGQELANILRELGYAPALESSGNNIGAVRQARTPPPSSSRVRLNPWTLSPEDIGNQLAVLRGGAHGPSAAPHGGRTVESETLLGLETLRKAIRLKSQVRLGIADSQGNSTRQVLVPLSVSGGRVRVFDPQKEVERVVSIHRVMDVEIVEEAVTDA